MKRMASSIKRMVTVMSVLMLAPVTVAASQTKVGQELPAFTLKALNPDVAGAAYLKTNTVVGAQGNKQALLISFFATYCEPCKKEMPFLKALQDAYGEAGLQVFLVSIDTDAEEIAALRELAELHKLTFPVLSDRFNIVAKRYGVTELPCVYTADEQATIQTIHTGYRDDTVKTMHDDVRAVLGMGADAPIPDPLMAFLGPPVLKPKVPAKALKHGKKKKKKKNRKRRLKK